MNLNKVYCVVYHPVGDLAIIEAVFEKMKDAESCRDNVYIGLYDGIDGYVEIVEMKVE